jgi:hypothetical protein
MKQPGQPLAGPYLALAGAFALVLLGALQLRLQGADAPRVKAE